MKNTGLYRYYFARKQAAKIGEWSDEDERRLAFYRQFTKAGDLVFDIGANLGNRTKVFVRLGCKVVALEPQRKCAAALKKAFNGRAEILNCAASDTIDTSMLRSVGHHHLASMSPVFIERIQCRFDNALWSAVETVSTTTLDVLIETYGLPKFVKIDVEGHEPSVLRGLSQAVPALSFEFHPELLDNALFCIEQLNRLGRYQYSFSPNESLEILPWLPSARGWGDVYARLN